MNTIDQQLLKAGAAEDLPSPNHKCQLDTMDQIGDYQIVRYLGEGRFATVYEAKNISGGKIALKVFNADQHNTHYYCNEVKILNLIFERNRTHPSVNLIDYYGTFVHVAIDKDRSPRLHPCIVFELCGDTLADFIKHSVLTTENGLPIHITKKITKDIFAACEYLHSCGIVHADIKSDNILLNSSAGNYDDTINIKLADFGTAAKTTALFSSRPGTDEYLAPELLILGPYDTAVDIWATCITCFEMLTGDFIFDVHGSCNIQYGADVDDREFISSSDDNSNDAEEDPDKDAKIAYSMLMLMTKVLGYPPPGSKFYELASAFYGPDQRLLYNNIKPITIGELLIINYDFDVPTCEQIEQFLLCGLKYDTEERFTAAAAQRHSWLSNI